MKVLALFLCSTIAGIASIEKQWPVAVVFGLLSIMWLGLIENKRGG